MAKLLFKTSFLLLIIVLTVALKNNMDVERVRAQSQLPPTIVDLTSSLQTITLADAERGMTPVTLTWQTVGTTDLHTVQLGTYQARVWRQIGENLAASGSLDTVISGVCGFCPITYRLTITAENGEILDQRILTIPLTDDTAEQQPLIAEFTTGVQRIDANALAQRSARIPVFWRITGRPANSHVVFEQILDADTRTSVDLPRDQLWVASSGQGEVAPTLPERENFVELSVRLIDLADNTTYVEERLIIPIIGSVTAPIVPIVSEPVTITGSGEFITDDAVSPENLPVINWFGATPDIVNRGESVTINWGTENLKTLFVARLAPDERFADLHLNAPAVGSWNVLVPDYYVDNVSFALIGVDDADNQYAATTTIRIRCPYTYFFDISSAVICPASGFVDVSGGGQRFERGYLLWRADVRQMIVLYDDRSYISYDDSWIEGEVVTPLAEPPEGLTAPEGRFAKVWLNNLDVLNGLGWAVEPATLYDIRLQQSGDYQFARDYFSLPDGRVAYLVADEGKWYYLEN